MKIKDIVQAVERLAPPSMAAPCFAVRPHYEPAKRPAPNPRTACWC